MILPYNLPDANLAESDKPFDYLVWNPQKTMIVIGNGDNPEDSVYPDVLLEERIPVIKRKSGGHAVVLSPKMLAVSAAVNTDPQPLSSDVFKTLNGAIITALQALSVFDLGQKGISDIAIGDKKIVGSAIYRNKKSVFFHAVINVGETPEIMEKTLKFPKRTPDYREKRPHSQFVTSLWNEGYLLSISLIREKIEDTLAKLSPNSFLGM